MNILIGGILVFMCSCASYIKNTHRYLDNHDKNRKTYSLHEKYKRASRQKVTTGNKKYVSPGVKRYYQPKKNVKKKRYKSHDFDDNRPDGSLWLASSGRNREFLFSKNVNVRSGDIVLIQVQEKLKNEITSELKRKFPVLGKKTQSSSSDAPAEKKESKKLQQNNEKIFDVISSIVVDEVNNNHLVVKGEKQILFRNKKRLVEIQALVNRQHIEPDGNLASNKIIENQIQVIRRLQ